jgi:hypothetical protein
MRSTNLILFLVLLNVAAGVTTAIAPGPVAIATGADAEIQGANSALGDRQVSQPSADEITGSLLGNAGIIETIDNILFLGPTCSRTSGTPGILVGGFKVVLGFVVAFDIAEA